jgi:hypothetical protein
LNLYFSVFELDEIWEYEIDPAYPPDAPVMRQSLPLMSLLPLAIFCMRNPLL